MNVEKCLHSLHSFSHGNTQNKCDDNSVVFVDEKTEKPFIKRVGNSVGNFCIHESLHFSTYPNMANCLGIILK